MNLCICISWTWETFSDLRVSVVHGYFSFLFFDISLHLVRSVQNLLSSSSNFYLYIIQGPRVPFKWWEVVSIINLTESSSHLRDMEQSANKSRVRCQSGSGVVTFHSNDVQAWVIVQLHYYWTVLEAATSSGIAPSQQNIHTYHTHL